MDVERLVPEHQPLAEHGVASAAKRERAGAPDARRRFKSNPAQLIFCILLGITEDRRFIGDRLRPSEKQVEPQNGDAMSAKYELLHETKVVRGAVLYRIRRLQDDLLGGFVESQENLDQNGTCFLHDESIAQGNARITENAQIYGEVFEQARVSGSAVVKGSVFGRAQVLDQVKLTGRAYDDAILRENALVEGEAFGSAVVEGSAHVIGRVFGTARVGGNEILYGERSS